MTYDDTHHDRMLMRALYRPTDGEIPLSVREIAEKFETTTFRVYSVVNMRPAKLEVLRQRETGNGSSSG